MPYGAGFYVPNFKSSSPSLFDGFDTQNVFSQEQLAGLYQNSFDYANKVWEREDSAYQRMVADMKKAGLNPWTGISSGGSPTSSVNPAESALNTLFSGLNYNLGVMKLSDKQNARLVDTYIDIVKIIAGVASGGLSALGSM